MKTVKEIIAKYEYWLAHNMIADQWEEDENTMGYEDINGNIIIIERDAKGNIVYAWE